LDKFEFVLYSFSRYFFYLIGVTNIKYFVKTLADRVIIQGVYISASPKLSAKRVTKPL